MMLGFEAVEQNFDVRRNNRVILLTDGIANEGVTDPDRIAADALAYNEQGIYLSTIGLGLDFNDALLIQLADQGQGGYTFVDSAEEMDRVFREHVAGLKQRVASDVSVTIIPEAGVRLVSLTGQSDLPPAEGAHVALWPLGTGDSSVVLAQLEAAPPAGQISSRSLARVQLHYFDEIAQRPVAVERTVSVDLAPDMKSYDPTWDLEILRNVTIQGAAEGMQEIDRLFQAGRYEAAWQLAVNLEDRLNNAAQLTGDQQMLKDVALMQRYQQTLAQALWETEDHAPRMAGVDRPEPGEERPYRGRADGTATPTPPVPTVKIR
jgi:Ca-activated chloride channel family protein